MEDEDTYDDDDDVMPSDTLIIRKEVPTLDGRISIMEAHVTQNKEAETGISWIKLYEKMTPENFSHFYIDTMNPELILNALENYLAEGKGPELAKFIRDEGKAVRDPVIFRLKLESALGSVQMGGDAKALAQGLF